MEYIPEIHGKRAKAITIDDRKWVLWAKKPGLISITREPNPDDPKEVTFFMDVHWDVLNSKLHSNPYGKTDEVNEAKWEQAQTMLGERFGDHKRQWEQALECLMADIAINCPFPDRQ